jgi:hypothetical protein
VRTLVGSIGLVAAVPVTTALAAIVAAREPVPESTVEEPTPVEPEPVAPRARRRPAERLSGDIYTGYHPDKGPWTRPQ